MQLDGTSILQLMDYTGCVQRQNVKFVNEQKTELIHSYKNPKKICTRPVP